MNNFPLKFLFVFLLSTSPAYAYLDPGTGSMILQMTIAGILSVAFTLKMYWYRIKNVAKRMLGQEVEKLPLETPLTVKESEAQQSK